MFILPVNVYKDVSGDSDLKDLNTEFKPVYKDTSGDNDLKDLNTEFKPVLSV